MDLLRVNFQKVCSLIEVSFVAEEISKLVKTKNYRYNDIILCMRSLDQYSYIIERVFDDYNIDYFLDEKISIMENPIIILILSILDMKDKNYSYDSVFRYLKSGLTGVSDEDIFLLENYVIANGIKGNRWFDESWNKSIVHSVEEESDDEKLVKINEIKNMVITPIKNLHAKLKGRNTVKDICKYLYEFTLEIGLFDRINELVMNFQNEGNLYKAKEYSQVWGSFTVVLDEMVEFMGEEKIAYSKFINLIKTELENIELGIVPPSKDEVFITTVDRMKKPSTKIAFVLGVNDGNFPKNIVDNDLISENEKESLKTFIYNAIQDIPGLSAVKPKAGLYIFPKIDRNMYRIDDDEQFVLDFLKQEKVLLVHGRGFNWQEPDHFRIVYLPRVDELAQIQEKMTRFLKQYRR